MKIEDIVKSNLSYEEKFDRALEVWEAQYSWIDEQTKETIDKYYERLQETLEAVRHLHCMKELGYDPIKDTIEDFNKLYEGV